MCLKLPHKTKCNVIKIFFPEIIFLTLELYHILPLEGHIGQIEPLFGFIVHVHIEHPSSKRRHSNIRKSNVKLPLM